MKIIFALLLMVSFSTAAQDIRPAGYKIDGNRVYPIDNIGNRIYNQESYSIVGKKTVPTNDVGTRVYNVTPSKSQAQPSKGSK